MCMQQVGIYYMKNIPITIINTNFFCFHNLFHKFSITRLSKEIGLGASIIYATVNYIPIFNSKNNLQTAENMLLKLIDL